MGIYNDEVEQVDMQAQLIPLILISWIESCTL